MKYEKRQIGTRDTNATKQIQIHFMAIFVNPSHLKPCPTDSEYSN